MPYANSRQINGHPSGLFRDHDGYGSEMWLIRGLPHFRHKFARLPPCFTSESGFVSCPRGRGVHVPSVLVSSLPDLSNRRTTHAVQTTADHARHAVPRRGFRSCFHFYFRLPTVRQPMVRPAGNRNPVDPYQVALRRCCLTTGPTRSDRLRQTSSSLVRRDSRAGRRPDAPVFRRPVTGS